METLRLGLEVLGILIIARLVYKSKSSSSNRTTNPGSPPPPPPKD